MFFGNYPGTIDEKGRVHIPALLKKLVGGDKTLMIARWGECLAAFPQNSFEKMGERLAELSKQEKYRDMVHRIVSNFFPGVIKNGKLLIPQELRNTLELDRKVQIVGMLDHMEIWNQSDWKRIDEKRTGTSTRDDLNKLGIL